MVICGLGLISLFAMMFAVATLSQTKATASVVEHARLQAAADSGVLLAAFRFVAIHAAPLGPGAVQGPVPMRLSCRMSDGIALLVSAADEGGNIDLKAADDELIRRLFVEFGATSDQATALVDAIVDYRDLDDLPRVHGAESAEYQAAGLAFGPKNALFGSVEELEQAGCRRNPIRQ